MPGGGGFFVLLKLGRGGGAVVICCVAKAVCGRGGFTVEGVGLHKELFPQFRVAISSATYSLSIKHRSSTVESMR